MNLLKKASHPISNLDDIIDSRDVDKRIEEIGPTLELADEGDKEELISLLALKDEGDTLSDWLYGTTLIRDSYFRTYAEELAEDIGHYDSANVNWPYTCIDWEKAADELKQDYTDIDFDGVTYWARA